MSSHLSAGGNHHHVDVDHTSRQLREARYSRVSLPVQHPHMWHPGDRVSMTTTDNQRYLGQVIDVSSITKSVLVELDPLP